SGLTNSRIVASYRERTPGSAALAKQASELLPSGIAHDARYLEPYGIYVERAQGPHKWDVDGNCYVDYFGGHGAHLFGHRSDTHGGAPRARLHGARNPRPFQDPFPRLARPYDIGRRVPFRRLG